MNWGDFFRVAVPIFAAVVTATAVIGVARWSQPTNKARWEAISAQLDVAEKMDGDDPMRDWMRKYAAEEIRYTARRSVNVGLAKWQWATALLLPVLSAANWVWAVIFVANLRRPLGPDAEDYCLTRGIGFSSQCTVDALAPGLAGARYEIATYFSCMAVLIGIGCYAIFRWNNSRSDSSGLARVLAANSRRRLPLLELARTMPRSRLGAGKQSADVGIEDQPNSHLAVEDDGSRTDL